MDSKAFALTLEPRETLQNVKAIKHCLDYLAIETARADLNFAAHLISVASEALQDAIRVAEQVREEIDIRVPKEKEANITVVKRGNGTHGGLS